MVYKCGICEKELSEGYIGILFETKHRKFDMLIAFCKTHTKKEIIDFMLKLKALVKWRAK